MDRPNAWRGIAKLWNSINKTMHLTTAPLSDVPVYVPPNNGSADQAYNQADLYILNLFKELALMSGNNITQTCSVAVVNDHFGALARGLLQLQHTNIQSFSDYASLTHAYKFNKISTSVQPISNLQSANSVIFLIKIPKQLNYFEYQCHLISKAIRSSQYPSTQEAHILFSGMQRYLPKSFYEVIYTYFV